ncbi:hypothetical protein MMC07_005185 [Pseudocyphellaria aurata]|nr:hypothetical protein [Pseudocyphellaria aurata]
MELFQAIKEEIFIALGPFKAQRLRLVNKVWSEQILRTMFATKIIDSHPLDRFQTMPNTLQARHLETRVFTDPRTRRVNALTTVMRRTVDRLLKETEQHSSEYRSKYTRVLCGAAADFLNSKRSTETLDQLKCGPFNSDYRYEDVRDVFAVAAHVGVVSLLQKLIDEGVEINAQSQYFGRALRGAAFGGHREAVLLLLECGADPNADSAPAHFNQRRAVLLHHHSTALQAAALAGHENVVRLLLEPKYHIRTSGPEYERAILYAAQGGHLRLLQHLMDNAEVLQSTKLQEWILLKASCFGHEPIVQLMLDLGTNISIGADWDNVEDESPLRVAAAHNFFNIVQLLLAQGADTDKGGNYEDFPPLYYAVQGGHRRVAETLLDHGADVNAGERTALEVSVTGGTFEMVRFLLERGAALETERQRSDTLYAEAAYRGHEPILRLLMKFGGSDDVEYVRAAKRNESWRRRELGMTTWSEPDKRTE